MVVDGAATNTMSPMINCSSHQQPRPISAFDSIYQPEINDQSKYTHYSIPNSVIFSCLISPSLFQSDQAAQNQQVMVDEEEDEEMEDE